MLSDLPIVNLTNNDIVVQLEEFLAKLRDSGFSVGLDTYIESLKILQWLNTNRSVTHIDPQVLDSYFSPVICKSDEEQNRFAGLFNTHFFAPLQKLSEDRKKTEKENTKKRIRKIVWIATALLLFSLSVIWFYYYNSNKPRLKYPNLTSNNFFVHRGQNESLNADSLFESLDDSADVKLKYHFFDDGSFSNGLNAQHIFNRYGNDSMQVFIRVKRSGLDTNVICKNIFVGPSKNPEINPEKSSIVEGDDNIYTIDIDTSYKASYYWRISVGDSILKTDSNKMQFAYRFSKTGDYLIQFWYNTLSNAFLDKFPDEYKSISITQKVALVKLRLDANHKTLPGIISSHIYIWWIVIAICLIMLFLFLAWRSWRKRQNVEKVVQPPKDEILYRGEKPPYDIPILSREHNINTDYKLLRLSNELRKRVEGNVEEINLKKTINASIANMGFLTPQFDKRQMNREYLFLIDQAYYNGQQVRLFEYLMNFFRNRSVTLDFYFYNQSPEKFYAKSGGQKQSLSYIKNRHYNASLIIIANGQSFIDLNTPVVKKIIVNNFAYWQTRILLTPVPFNDWAGNEKTLADFFILAPADIQGLVQLVKLINEGENDDSPVSRNKFFAYESKYVDFDDEGSLREYLNDDENLFQWLCATAVYSKIRWEVFLETGKVILSDKSKICYGTLLKFVRIKWMQEGSFPASTRLMLLKQLTVENELKARETMLHILNEVTLGDDSYSLEEKRLNLYTNSFILFASGNEQYQKKDIEENAEKFISLYCSNRLLDMPLKIYVEKKETGGLPGRHLSSSIVKMSASQNT